jgi:hypothetical protein
MVQQSFFCCHRAVKKSLKFVFLAKNVAGKCYNLLVFTSAVSILGTYLHVSSGIQEYQ